MGGLNRSEWVGMLRFRHLWATSIGYSRMYLGVHYLSDVLSGAIIGALAAYISFQIQQRIQEQRSELGLPETKGLIIPISLSF